jgi:hypothetical protein
MTNNFSCLDPKLCENCSQELKPDLLLGFFDVCQNPKCKLAYKKQKGVKNDKN